MRLHLTTNPSRRILSYNYQRRLTGAIHKWLGTDNPYHGQSALFSFSLLNGGESVKDQGMRFPRGARWFISSFHPEFAKMLMQGILRDPIITEDLAVEEMMVQEDPTFGQAHIFKVGSPVLVKQRRPDNTTHHFIFSEPATDALMTATLQGKLTHAGLPAEGLHVEFHRNFPGARAKVLHYNEVQNRVNFCPVAIIGSPEQLAFAWNVGIGHSTGIGFGSLI